MTNSKQILVVDDNKTNLKLIKDLLTVKGYEVLEAYNGEEAIKKAQKNNDSLYLILMDIQMPIMNGFEAIKELKSNKNTKDIPIIVLSAQAMNSDIKTAQKLGAEDYITKPINVIEFLSKVEDFTK